jgi:hypothetical protein
MASAFKIFQLLVNTRFMSKTFTLAEYELKVAQALWRKHSTDMEATFLGCHDHTLDLNDPEAVSLKFEELCAKWWHPEGESAALLYYGSEALFTQALTQMAVSGQGEMDELMQTDGMSGLKAIDDASPPLNDTDTSPEDGTIGKLPPAADDPDPEKPANEQHDARAALNKMDLNPKFKKRIIDGLVAGGINFLEDILETADEELINMSWVTESNLQSLKDAAKKALFG